MIDKIKFSLLFFVVVFIGFYILYYLIFDDKLKKEKYTKISELVLLTKKFNLDKKKMDYRKCLKGVALINAFIIAITVVVVDLIGLNNQLQNYDAATGLIEYTTTASISTSLYSGIILNLYTKPRSILGLYKHKEYYSAESYYTEKKSRPAWKNYLFQIGQILKYGAVNEFYFMYGMDVKTNVERNTYMNYAPFMKRRHYLNHDRNIQNSNCILRNYILTFLHVLLEFPFHKL